MSVKQQLGHIHRLVYWVLQSLVGRHSQQPKNHPSGDQGSHTRQDLQAGKNTQYNQPDHFVIDVGTVNNTPRLDSCISPSLFSQAPFESFKIDIAEEDENL